MRKQLLGIVTVMLFLGTTLVYTVTAAEADPPVWITCPSGIVVSSGTTCPPAQTTP